MRQKEVGREKEKRQREKDILAKKRKVEQRDQLLLAPTREETETKETESPTLLLKHKSTKHRSLRRADNALPSCPRMKKEIVTILSKEYSVQIHLNEPKKSRRKPITLNDKEKE